MKTMLKLDLAGDLELHSMAILVFVQMLNPVAKTMVQQSR
ncbi:hypothetical protein C5167_048737 [Papaver somniferum]|uniref:Uncharacterized protein n=1 Tax=Papaver somniferum TaxID=3469 RepID=A0A4Y7KMZ6_PAPSO|nr:hypothetical protein C5167_048737 [Papaver somniferum]